MEHGTTFSHARAHTHCAKLYRSLPLSLSLSNSFCICPQSFRSSIHPAPWCRFMRAPIARWHTLSRPGPVPIFHTTRCASPEITSKVICRLFLLTLRNGGIPKEKAKRSFVTIVSALRNKAGRQRSLIYLPVSNNFYLYSQTRSEVKDCRIKGKESVAKNKREHSKRCNCAKEREGQREREREREREKACVLSFLLI